MYRLCACMCVCERLRQAAVLRNLKVTRNIAHNRYCTWRRFGRDNHSLSGQQNVIFVVTCCRCCCCFCFCRLFLVGDPSINDKASRLYGNQFRHPFGSATIYYMKYFYNGCASHRKPFWFFPVAYLHR